jgi:hypothetical protein
MQSLLFQMWRLCLRVMLIGAICVCALPDNPSLVKSLRKREATQRYCGKNLVNILRFLCRSQYNGIEEERKRSEEANQRKVQRGTVHRTSSNIELASFSFPPNTETKRNETKQLRGRIPQANYTERATAACRRS